MEKKKTGKEVKKKNPNGSTSKQEDLKIVELNN